MTRRPRPLGPDSLTWKYFGQWTRPVPGHRGRVRCRTCIRSWARRCRSTRSSSWSGCPRLLRSIYPIGGVVFDGDRAPKTGAEVRDYHIGIKGVDEQGRRYSALNPEVFYWAHATFFKSTLLAAEKFGGGLTEADKRQLFDEHITWYRMYGMSMRPVPKTWEEFQEYWDHMCTQRVGEQLGGARGHGSVDHAQTSVAAVDSGLAVGAEPQGDAALPDVHDRRRCTTRRCGS